MTLKHKVSGLLAGSAVMAATAFGCIGTAQADGMPSKGRAVVYEAPSNWGGFYFGVHSGYSWSEYDNRFANFGTSFSVDDDRPFVGGQIGLQGQFGQIVLGVDASISSAFRDAQEESSCPNTDFRCGAAFADVITVGPRIGWAMGKWMPYVTGGYANAAFEHLISTNDTLTPTRWSRERTDGWYIGGGFEMMVAAGWTVGLEYRHFELDGSFSHKYFVPSGADLPLASDADMALDTIALRVSWKFGWPERSKPLK
jgi:opacity protein-like surface antigen